MKDDIDLVNAYRNRNESFTTKLIYPLTDRGWASEINNLALVMLYCLENGIELQLYTEGWNSGKWDYYFEPFCQTFTSPMKVPVFIFSDAGKKRKLYKTFHKLAYKNTYLTDNQRWNSIKNMGKESRHYEYPDLNINGDIFHAMQQLFAMLLRPIATFKEEIDATLETFEARSVLGIHVRRGDKLIREAGMFPVEEYVTKAQQASFAFSKMFIASDSGQTLTEFEAAFPEMAYTSFCDVKSEGHDQRTFNNRTIEARVADTKKLIKDIYILKTAPYFVGTFSSNVGRLVHTLRNGKDSLSLDETWYPG